MRNKFRVIIIAVLSCLQLQYTFAQTKKKQSASAYLFAYFTGNSKADEAIRFALSKDGYNYLALNNNKPVITSDTISETGGVRDPHILRGADGKTFYMVATDMVSANGWNSNRAMVLMKSADLVSWSHAVVNIQKTFADQDKLERVWAPQTIYDAKAKKYMIYWAMKYEGGTDKIYYAYANKDFTALESTPQVLFIPPNKSSCIDADIIEKDGKFHLFIKTEDEEKGIKQAVSDNLTQGYVLQDVYLQQTDKPVEGSGVFKLNDKQGYILMYDMYTSGRYQFTYSEDLEHFKAIDADISMNFHPRHGTVMPITNAEAERLLATWPLENNPLFGGLYADPEVLYSNKTNKYYIYPTSDGFNNWSGTYFKTFSSPNLVHWKDAGVILDLNKDVSWAKRNAWAPTIIEKKIDGQYKYFYYFCAAQKIGVAVANDPEGPFVDAGSALISKHPHGVNRGQEIDPDVFEDPVTGKDYLYWGNGYMAVAELDKDMISIDTNSIKIITPDNTLREGTEVFYRKGKYYFMWSEDDTRSPNYRVRYGYAATPTGPLTIPANNMVIKKDTAQGIYGTGHNCVLNIPGTDDWYIIYHRFNRPEGIKMGEAAGYNREVCIDKLLFNEDGSIKEVIPTVKGIAAPVLPKLKP